MKTMRRRLAGFFVGAIVCGIGCSSQSARSEDFELRSPDGKVAIHVFSGDVLTWSATFGDRTIIQPSSLGLELVDGPLSNGAVQLKRQDVTTVDDTWKWDFGAASQIRNNCREATLTLSETRPQGRTFQIVLRAYDNGVALRYVFPEKFSSGPLQIVAERTEFNFDKDYTAWIGDLKTNVSHQETEYPSGPLSRLTPESFGEAPIVVKEADDCYVALAEASLFKWAGMYFSGTAGDPKTNLPRISLVSKLSARPADDKRPTVEMPLPAKSPWRVVMIGRTPGDLVESNLLLNLNEPSQIADTSWIKPGMSAWDHWWTGEVKMDTATIHEYIDLSAAMGWPYMLVDWWWYGNPDAPDADVFSVNPTVDLPEVRHYAADKGVKLWMWLQWDDIERGEAYRKLFPLLHEWGVVGIKIDFMQRDDQWMVEWYDAVVQCAAENQLMVDFHGAYKPTGEMRTWPNLLTREGVLGNEYNKWSNRITPSHRATLPFTRGLVGPMDFTPGGFLNRQPAQHRTSKTAAEVQGTRAQELALFVVYHSPFTCVCDAPKNILDAPGADFLKAVPTVWDETKVLAGEIGEYAVVARRSGDRWFVGGITNEQDRRLEIDFGFLPKGRWQVKLWNDGPDAASDATSIAVQNVALGDNRKLPIELAPAGGFAAELIPRGE
jgi:alpha-glucosidase